MLELKRRAGTMVMWEHISYTGNCDIATLGAWPEISSLMKSAVTKQVMFFELEEMKAREGARVV